MVSGEGRKDFHGDPRKKEAKETSGKSGRQRRETDKPLEKKLIWEWANPT